MTHHQDGHAPPDALAIARRNTETARAAVALIEALEQGDDSAVTDVLNSAIHTERDAFQLITTLTTMVGWALRVPTEHGWPALRSAFLEGIDMTELGIAATFEREADKPEA